MLVQVNCHCLRLVAGSLSSRKVMVHSVVGKNSIMEERETTFTELIILIYDLALGSL